MDIEKLCMGCMNELNTDDGEFCPKCGYRLNGTNPSRGLHPHTILNGKYLVGKVIGEGGFGITYIGFDLILNSRVAIKEYFPIELASRDTSTGVQTSLSVLTGSKEEQYKKGIEQFVNEASNLAKFNDLPGIVSARDFFYENKTAYMVMEYIDGVTLSEYLKQNGDKLPYQKVLDMMKPVMDSLQKVHEAGMIHRDISPDNIMVSKEGELKLIDFGAARFVGNEDQKSLTVILKHGYAPEEQYQTNGKQGPWTDVYALAATMYRMITGIVPQEATERILSGDKVVPVNKIVSDVPKSVSDAIMHGMGIRTSERIQSAELINEELTNDVKRVYSYILIPFIALGIFLCIVSLISIVRCKKASDNTSSTISEMSEIEEELEETKEKDVLQDTEIVEVDMTANAAYKDDDEVFEVPEDVLVSWIKDISNVTPEDVCYDDYDGDGIRECFALCVTDVSPVDYEDDILWTKADIWFANSSIVQKMDSIQGERFDDNRAFVHKGKTQNSKNYEIAFGRELDYYDEDVDFTKKEFTYNSIPIEIVNNELQLSSTTDINTADYIELSEDELISKIENESNSTMDGYFYEDYNNDGIKELYAYDIYMDVFSDWLSGQDNCVWETNIWFADSKSVQLVGNIQNLEGYGNFNESEMVEYGKSHALIAQFGKIKQLIILVTENDNEVGLGTFYSFGYDELKNALSYGNNNGTIMIGDQKTYYVYCLDNNPLNSSRKPTLATEIYFMNGEYIELASNKLDNERLKYLSGIDRIREEIKKEFSEGNIYTTVEKKETNALNENYPFSIPIDDYFYYSSDGNIYINYTCWKEEVNNETIESWMDFPTAQKLKEENGGIEPYQYYYARISVDQDILSLDGLFEGCHVERISNSFLPNYPNIKRFVRE